MKIFALMLFTLVPALALFLILYAIGCHWAMASIIAGGLFGLGLDVCLRGK